MTGVVSRVSDPEDISPVDRSLNRPGFDSIELLRKEDLSPLFSQIPEI